MKKFKLGALAAAAALVASVPALAQPGRWNNDAVGASSSNWDRDGFWRGAPESVMQRIAFMQRRIDRGVADRSISRSEGRIAQRELQSIRWEAQRMRGRLSMAQQDRIQQRLDALGARIRWQRQNSAYRSGGLYEQQRSWDSNDRRFVTDYDAQRYYRAGPNYRERTLTYDDEVYRGSDGRYYCKRSDGTTGLVIGAIAGGTIGNVIDGGHDRLAGTLIGGALGALAGQAIERGGDVRCR